MIEGKILALEKRIVHIDFKRSSTIGRLDFAVLLIVFVEHIVESKILFNLFHNSKNKFSISPPSIAETKGALEQEVNTCYTQPLSKLYPDNVKIENALRLNGQI